MNIIVCVKPIPDPEQYSKLKLDPKTKRLIREGIPSVINPSDLNALEMGLSLREKHGGKVIIVSMCPEFSRMQIKECLARGADEGYILSDRKFGGADTFATSHTIVHGIRELGIEPDLILGGSESVDGATSQVIAQIGEWMKIPHMSSITGIDIEGSDVIVERKIPNGTIEYQIEMPAVLGIARSCNKPRMMTAKGIIECRDKKLDILGYDDLHMEKSGYVGLEGSPTQPGELIEPDTTRASVKLDGSHDQIAEQILDVIKKTGYQIP